MVTFLDKTYHNKKFTKSLLSIKKSLKMKIYPTVIKYAEEKNTQ